MILVPKGRKTLGHIKRGYTLLVANSLNISMYEKVSKFAGRTHQDACPLQTWKFYNIYFKGVTSRYFFLKLYNSWNCKIFSDIREAKVGRDIIEHLKKPLSHSRVPKFVDKTRLDYKWKPFLWKWVWFFFWE